jgi:RNA polymerase sigma factor (TIGR02999 family)
MNREPRANATELLMAWRDGHEAALGQLTPQVDFARRRRFQKRGGSIPHTLAEALDVSTSENPDLAAVDAALQQLSKLDARKAQVVELRFLGGMTLEKTAETQQVSTDAVGRDWTAAKAWLARELKR